MCAHFVCTDLKPSVRTSGRKDANAGHRDRLNNKKQALNGCYEKRRYRKCKRLENKNRELKNGTKEEKEEKDEQTVRKTQVYIHTQSIKDKES